MGHLLALAVEQGERLLRGRPQRVGQLLVGEGGGEARAQEEQAVAFPELMAREVGPELFVEAQGLGGVGQGRHEPGQGAVVEDGGGGGGHLAQVRLPAGRGPAA